MPQFFSKTTEENIISNKNEEKILYVRKSIYQLVNCPAP